MRLDKFLKVCRVIKRRPVAKEVCMRGQVRVNGRVAKAGTEVKAGDIIELVFGGRRLKLEVTAAADDQKTVPAAERYKIIREEKIREEKEETPGA